MRIELVEARKNKQFSQVKLAEKLGISPRYYQYIEAGTRDGRLTIWQRLESILGVQQTRLQRNTTTPDLFVSTIQNQKSVRETGRTEAG